MDMQQVKDDFASKVARQRPQVKFNEFLANQIAISGKQQNEIASELGYDKPNIITMFKKGQTKVPIEKVPALAKAIGVDQAFLLRMAMNEYMPETMRAIEKVFGTILTDNEEDIVKGLRSLTDNADPKVQTEEHRRKLKEFADSLMGR